jgi:hypothetical protein
MNCRRNGDVPAAGPQKWILNTSNKVPLAVLSAAKYQIQALFYTAFCNLIIDTQIKMRLRFYMEPGYNQGHK